MVLLRPTTKPVPERYVIIGVCKGTNESLLRNAAANARLLGDFIANGLGRLTEPVRHSWPATTRTSLPRLSASHLCMWDMVEMVYSGMLQVLTAGTLWLATRLCAILPGLQLP